MPRLASAQERTPADRQAMSDLAYVLGESHALRQACLGQTDQLWRERMQSVLEVEAPDQAFNLRLRNTFNAGFAAAQAEFPKCDDRSKAQAEKIARRGKALSERLSAP
jgi:uncharacterized protein (TIGR02301 family)